MTNAYPGNKELYFDYLCRKQFVERFFISCVSQESLHPERVRTEEKWI